MLSFPKFKVHINHVTLDAYCFDLKYVEFTSANISKCILTNILITHQIYQKWHFDIVFLFHLQSINSHIRSCNGIHTYWWSTFSQQQFEVSVNKQRHHQSVWSSGAAYMHRYSDVNTPGFFFLYFLKFSFIQHIIKKWIIRNSL